MGSRMSACAQGQSGCSDTYLQSRVAMTVLDPLTKAGAKTAIAKAKFMLFKAGYTDGPSLPIYQEHPFVYGQLYSGGTGAGRFLERTAAGRFVPASENVAGMRASGAGLLSRGIMIEGTLRFVRVAGDVWALSNCTDGQCEPVEFGAIALDAISNTADGAGKFVESSAAGMFSLDPLNSSVRGKMIAGTVMRIGSNSVFIAAGALRLGIELDRYLETGDFNGSAVAQASQEMIGGAWVITDRSILLQRMSEAGAMAGKTGVVEDFMFSTRAATALRSFGVASGAIGIGINLYSLVANGILVEGEDADRYIISGALGLASSGLFLVSALIVAKALAPICLILTVGGFLFLAAQAVYDISNDFDAPSRKEGPPDTVHIDENGIMHFQNLWRDADGAPLPEEFIPECERLEHLDGLDYECVLPEGSEGAEEQIVVLISNGE